MAVIRFRFLLAGIVLLYASPTTAQQYTVTDLGTLGGEERNYGTAAYAINASGSIVGSSVTSSGARHPFLWTPDKGIQDLGTLPNAEYCAAIAINDSGNVAGHCLLSIGQAFLWTRAKA
jgi:probable HAF family extracellular repeat protein